VFDEILDALSAYEEGMANATLKSTTAIAAKLTDISNKAIVLTNRGSLPSGTKSWISRINKWAKETAIGLKNGEFKNLTEIRRASKDQLGVMHAGLRQAINGGVSAENKEMVRTTFEADEDKQEEVDRLVAAFDPGSTKIMGIQIEAEKIRNDVITFLDQNFSVSQLRSIRPYLPLEDGQTKQKRDPDCVWNRTTYLEIREALDPQHKAKRSALKRELVQKHDDEYATLSESYKDLKRRLPHTVQHAFTAIRFPVIPVFKDISVYKNPRKLESADLQVTRIGDHFVVLENQLLLCVDLAKLGIKESIRLTKDKQRMKSVKNSDELGAAIIDIVNEINVTAQRSGVKLVMASDTIVRNPNNAGIALVWLISEHSRRMLAETLNNSQVTWDIPRHNIEAPQLSHGKTPAETQKLIDASYAKHGSSRQLDASINKHRNNK